MIDWLSSITYGLSKSYFEHLWTSWWIWTFDENMKLYLLYKYVIVQSRRRCVWWVKCALIGWGAPEGFADPEMIQVIQDAMRLRRSNHLWQVDNVSWLRHVVGNVLRSLNSSQLDQTLSRLLQNLVSKSCSIMVMHVWVVVWLSTKDIYRIRVQKMNQPCENGWHSLHLGKSIGKQLCGFGVSLSLTWEKLMPIFGNTRRGQAPE